MDCKQFYEQVVRLDGIKELADQFVRVRLARVDHLDLNLFEFDYDLTFMVFFTNARERVYGRFGGRMPKDPDSYHSLAGLRYAMQAALETHTEDADLRGEEKPPLYIRDFPSVRKSGGCFHCHQLKEIMLREADRKGEWTNDLIWRYPPPQNVGITLEVDRGNVVRRVKAGSPAAKVGLRKGDVIERLGQTKVRSFGDAQFALDKAPKQGQVELAWSRDGQRHEDQLVLPQEWRGNDILWRRSVRHRVAYPRLFGEDLTTVEKKEIGLEPDRLAFRQKKSVPKPAREAGIRAGDIILGFDDRPLEMDAYDFQDYVAQQYLMGDEVTVNLIRNGQRHNLPMTLQ